MKVENLQNGIQYKNDTREHYLPIQDGWKLSKLDIEEEKLEVHVYLFYEPKTYKIGDLKMSFMILNLNLNGVI